MQGFAQPVVIGARHRFKPFVFCCARTTDHHSKERKLQFSPGKRPPFGAAWGWEPHRKGDWTASICNNFGEEQPPLPRAQQRLSTKMLKSGVATGWAGG